MRGRNLVADEIRARDLALKIDLEASANSCDLFTHPNRSTVMGGKRGCQIISFRRDSSIPVHDPLTLGKLINMQHLIAVGPIRYAICRQISTHKVKTFSLRRHRWMHV